MKTIDMTGMVFPLFKVLGKADIKKGGEICWRCLCHCGQEFVSRGYCLRKGHTTSCGCEKIRKTIERSTTHGLSNSKCYREWNEMRQRCSNPNDQSWDGYGGRGITLYPEWKNSFESFYAHVSKLPHFGEKGYSLNRIDNDGPYAPGNLEWATAVEQANNRQSSHLVTWRGETHSIAEWARILKKPYMMLYKRIHRGLSPDKVFN